MNKIKTTLFSMIMCLIHTVDGASDVANLTDDVTVLCKALDDRISATQDEGVLSDPARSHENLNEVIAAACAHTRGNGGI